MQVSILSMQNAIIRLTGASIRRAFGPRPDTSYYQWPNCDSYSNLTMSTFSMRYSAFCWVKAAISSTFLWTGFFNATVLHQASRWARPTRTSPARTPPWTRCTLMIFVFISSCGGCWRRTRSHKTFNNLSFSSNARVSKQLVGHSILYLK